MSQQPEALKHAEWLERSMTIGAPEAAAELRRLHARDRAWWAANTELEADNAALRAQVERLQAAQGQVVGSIDHVEWSVSKEQWRHNIWADVKIPFGTKLCAVTQPSAAPVVAGRAVVPLSPAQINEIALQEQFLLSCDDIEALTEIVRAVELAHGINGLTVGGGGAKP